MIKYRRADFTDFNSITLGVLLTLVFFPIGIFLIILASPMAGQTKAIVSIVVLIGGFVPLIMLGVAFSQIGSTNNYPAKMEPNQQAMSSVKRTRIIYNAPTCKEGNFYLRQDIPLCKPGQDNYKNKEIIEID